MTQQYLKNLKLPFEDVVEKLKDQLQRQGFTMLTSIDMRDYMRDELGVKFRNYRIFTACNTELSYKAISLEPHIGTILPCNIVIQEHENGQTEISAINPMEALDKNMITSSLEGLASEISAKLRAAIDTVQSKSSLYSLSYN